MRRLLAISLALLVAQPVAGQETPDPCLRELRSPVETVRDPPGIPPPGSPYPIDTAGCERGLFSSLTSTCRLICVDIPGNAQDIGIRHEVLAGVGTDNTRWVAAQDGEGLPGVGFSVVTGAVPALGLGRHCVSVSNRILGRERGEIRVRIVLRYRLPAGQCG